MAIKKSQLYASLWQSCDELRGGMDTSQYKDYILTLLFMKYVSDKAANDPYPVIEVPEGGSFKDMVELRGDKEIGDKINKIIGKLAEANDLRGVIDQADFNDDSKLGRGREMQDRLSRLVAIFNDLDLSANRAEGDDLLGDAYEYLMQHFATESGKSKGQFYTPAEVSRIMAQVIGIGPETLQTQTIYDPTCGSGSLLLRAADKTPNGITVSGQEKDNATYALARMNMILHGNETAQLWSGNTLTDPYFKDAETRLKTFDFAVANPPFSDKAWTNGLDPDNDIYGRFDGYGIPPTKNGDYAFLLHFIASLKSTAGKGAIILPHGVLFRGNREADIRRNLIQRGFIKGIIGLPSNLFYGTGIPACILVIDKENSHVRKGIFMIDASQGFHKDGNKNRLRAQDIHKIVSVFNAQTELPRYSGMVPLAKITENNYKLNIQLYIDMSEPEDLHDLDAYLNGGIPDRDIEALDDYWEVFPTLRDALFEGNGRPGYSDPLVEAHEVRTTILTHSEFQSYQQHVNTVFEGWRAAHEDFMSSIGNDTVPREVIRTLSEDLLNRFDNLPLLDQYDVYQQLMDYWDETMQDDVYLIAAEGWIAGRILRLAYDKETPDFSIKKGQKTVKYIGELIPASLVVTRFFDDEKRKLEHLEAELEILAQHKEEFEEEHGDGEGALVGLEGSKGSITKSNVEQRVKEHRENLLKVYPEETAEHARVQSVKQKDLGNREWIENIRNENNLFQESDPSYTDEAEGILEELDVLYDCLELIAEEASQKKTYKQTLDSLYASVIAKYTKLTETEIKMLVVTDKWCSHIQASVECEIQRIAREFTDLLKKLEERYARTLPDLELEVKGFSMKVNEYLEKMGVA